MITVLENGSEICLFDFVGLLQSMKGHFNTISLNVDGNGLTMETDAPYLPVKVLQPGIVSDSYISWTCVHPVRAEHLLGMIRTYFAGYSFQEIKIEIFRDSINVWFVEQKLY